MQPRKTQCPVCEQFVPSDVRVGGRHFARCLERVRRERRNRYVRHALAAAFVFLVCMAPWCSA